MPTTHLLGEVAAIAQALPNERIALQWDVCQEVIAWEGYYEPGPVDFQACEMARGQAFAPLAGALRTGPPHKGPVLLSLGLWGAI